ncbi:LppX_LprAFG lipoprotein [Actinophytocola oryzae]|uniref:Lipoprotein LprG n=1 Tax=Actinophytocola oryzae TaxID=502181 RepID=A0A4R7USM7_9PSEU|nr:LppX_LprAFG lipoprotein [Actinophytocola oryzae]TDV37543.1 lipoprotein LprG [Actinophytocola oryzae]
MMRRILFVTLALTTAFASACSSSEETPAGGGSSLPDGAGLLKDAAASTADIRSAHFTLTVNGELPEIPVKKAEGDLTREGGDGGGAKGTVSMKLLGDLFEGDFVLVGNSLYIKGPTGGWQELPASMVRSLYDPAAILDPDRGVAKVLASVRDPKTEGTEDVDGVSTYRVTGRVEQDVVKNLVPGVGSDVDITFWVRQDGGHQPVKASVKLGEPTVDVTLSDIDKQVTITAPK